MKESWDFNIAEREGVLRNTEVLEEKVVNEIEKTECPYDLDKPYQVTTVDSLIAGSLESYKNFFDAVSKGNIDYLYEDEMVLLNFNPLSREFLGERLVHMMSLENYMILNSDDYLGDNKDNGGVYLQTADSVVMPNHDVFRKGQTVVRLIIDTDTLFLKGRKIYLDEESLTQTPEEYGKSFFMYGGIPKSAIKKVQFLKIGSIDTFSDDDYSFLKKSYSQREKEFNRRLQSLRDRL